MLADLINQKQLLSNCRRFEITTKLLNARRFHCTKLKIFGRWNHIQELVILNLDCLVVDELENAVQRIFLNLLKCYKALGHFSPIHFKQLKKKNRINSNSLDLPSTQHS